MLICLCRALLLFFLMRRQHQRSTRTDTRLPDTTLFRSRVGEGDAGEDRGGVGADPEHQAAQAAFGLGQAILAMFMRIARRAVDERERADRKSTRLNSSH